MVVYVSMLFFPHDEALFNITLLKSEVEYLFRNLTFSYVLLHLSKLIILKVDKNSVQRRAVVPNEFIELLEKYLMASQNRSI